MKEVVIVKGYVATWTIKETSDGKYSVGSGGKEFRQYTDLKTAHNAIRVAEQRCMQAKPETKNANPNIWFDFGVLITDDNDGNYYN